MIPFFKKTGIRTYLPFLLIAAFFGAPLLLHLRSGQGNTVHFRSLPELQQVVEANGLFVHRDIYSPFDRYMIWVADHPISDADIKSLVKFNCSQCRKWQGIVWISDQRSTADRWATLDAHSLENGGRFWGNLLVTGDPALMDRIEELCAMVE